MDRDVSLIINLAPVTKHIRRESLERIRISDIFRAVITAGTIHVCGLSPKYRVIIGIRALWRLILASYRV